MIAARKIYGLNGFKVKDRQTYPYGDYHLDVLTMERDCS